MSNALHDPTAERDACGIGLVADARDPRGEVELRPEPVEGGGGVTGGQDGVRGRGRATGCGRQQMAGSGQRLGVERRVKLLDVEAVLASQPGERAAGRGGDLGPDPVAGEAGDDVRLPGGHGWFGVGVGRVMAVLLSLGTPRGRTSGVVSVGVCAFQRVSVDLP